MTILSDDLINSTEFRNNQSRWLNKAYESPISIISGKKKLVLLNREFAKNMYQLNNYAGLVARFCREQYNRPGKKSEAFPWIKHLNEKEIAQFHMELLSAFVDAIRDDNISVLEEVVGDWKATAEVAGDAQLSKRLLEEGDSAKYVPID